MDASQETRIAVVDDVNGDVVNCLVAESVQWVQENVCTMGQTAYDVKGLPVSSSWVRDAAGGWYRDTAIGEEETAREIILRDQEDRIVVDAHTGFAKTSVELVG